MRNVAMRAPARAARRSAIADLADLAEVSFDLPETRPGTVRTLFEHATEIHRIDKRRLAIIRRRLETRRPHVETAIQRSAVDQRFGIRQDAAMPPEISRSHARHWSR